MSATSRRSSGIRTPTGWCWPRSRPASTADRRHRRAEHRRGPEGRAGAGRRPADRRSRRWAEYNDAEAGAIRGITSEGMVCSEKELGLSDEHEGILVLEADAPVGVPLAEYLGDTVIEFEITPNLVHAFSVLGIAREAGALTDRPVTTPPIYDLASAPSGRPTWLPSRLRISARATSRSSSRRRRSDRRRPGCTAAPGRRGAPDQQHRRRHELRDARYGQPLHAFDADRLADGRIVVRRARPGETLETLDHQVRTARRRRCSSSPTPNARSVSPG